MRRQTRMKAEQIARMLWMGHSPTRVAHMMGISYDGLRHITKTPEFQEIDAEVRRRPPVRRCHQFFAAAFVLSSILLVPPI